MRALRIDVGGIFDRAAELSQAEREEMAIPSYSNPNPLIRWLFWHRLDVALDLARIRRGERVLDLGTGSGVLLPTLARLGAIATGADIDMRAADQTVRSLGLDVRLVSARDLDDAQVRRDGSFHCIFALDVLEHVDQDEFDRLADSLTRLLDRRGRLIVSGPTETFFYRLGRRLAGYDGHYHERSIYDVERALARQWSADAVIRVPGAPLPCAFRIGRYFRNADAVATAPADASASSGSSAGSR